MDFGTTLFLIAPIIAGVVVYAIKCTNDQARLDRDLKHKEFSAQLEPQHREKMASIGANRDAEIAKATKKDPSMTTIGGSSQRQIEG